MGGSWHSLPLEEQIQLARQEFGKPPPGHVPLFQLTISHKHRMSLIRSAQKAELQEARQANKHVLWLPPIFSSMQNRTQGLLMFPGKLMIAIATAKTVYNSQLLRCTKVSGSCCAFEDYETGAQLSLPNQSVQRFLRNARAMTYASVQGRGFDEVKIHTASAKFTKRHLFMALSRARSSQRLWIME